jgi:uncharacterized protein YjiS (DUF1127 family)
MSSLQQRRAALRFDRRVRPAGYSDRAFGRFALLRAALTEALRRARSRGDLARLTDRELRDIGLTRDDALRESGKPFWRE